MIRLEFICTEYNKNTVLASIIENENQHQKKERKNRKRTSKLRFKSGKLKIEEAA